MSAATREMALQVAFVIPGWADPPSVSATPTGGVVFEWRSGDAGILTLSVREGQRLAYAAITPERRHKGSEDFLGMLPVAIIPILRKFAGR